MPRDTTAAFPHQVQPVPRPGHHWETPVWHLLLHLMAAISAGQTDDHLQLFSSIVDKLLFEGSLFCFSGPSQSLIQIQQPVHT